MTFVPPIWNAQICTHTILMTIILFIGYPASFALLLSKNTIRYHKILHGINTATILILSLYANFSFSKGTCFHSKIAVVSIIASVIQSILLMFASNPQLNYVWSVYMVIFKLNACFLLPITWYFGMIHTVRPTKEGYGGVGPFGDPTGHCGVGMMFYWFGLLSVWNPDTRHGMYTITNAEMVFLPLAGIIESVGEYSNVQHYGHVTVEGIYHHFTADILLFVAGCLCIIYFLLFRDTYHEVRVRLHTITIGFVGFVMGFILLNHGRASDTYTRIVVHKLVGAAIMLGAIGKLLQKWLFSGIVSIFVGGLFMGASGIPNNAWTHYKYPEIIYITIDLFMAFYVAIINLLLYYIDQINNENNKNDPKENGFVSENVPFLQDTSNTISIQN